jgi:hypothetical protein
MKLNLRRKLEMASRLCDLARARLDTNPGYVAAVDRLTDRLARAETLAQQAVAGQQAASGSVAARKVLREVIADTLALLAGLARGAAHEQPELAAGISRRDSGSNQAFLTRGRVAAATAVTHRDLLQRYGMPDTFPEDLGRMLDEFEAALNQKHAGRAAHVGANAELEAVTAEVMRLVQQLDALNRFRFRNDAEALGAWRSARNVAWPLGERPERGPEGGSVRPAA